MIPLFGGQPKSRWNCLEITIRAVPINLAGAIASSILALGYFGVAFATGEAGRTFPTSVIVILAVIVVAVAAVGASSGCHCETFSLVGRHPDTPLLGTRL